MKDILPKGPTPGTIEDQLLRNVIKANPNREAGWLVQLWEGYLEPKALAYAAEKLGAEKVEIVPGLVHAWRVPGHPELTDNQLLDLASRTPDL